MKKIIVLIVLVSLFSCKNEKQQASKDVLARVLGKKAEIFDLKLVENSSKTDEYSVSVKDRKVIVEANSQVALCRGAYDYLKNDCNSIISWSGDNINIPEQLPVANRKVVSPYQYHYYFNVVTHGYTTPYWDWARWEKEIDWMALHGMNMPLIGGAHEAILARVFEKLGFTKAEIAQYMSGPAHFPWNRMGNLNDIDSPFPDSYYSKQIALNHKILDRMRSLGMKPIVHAFAGFVPRAINRLYPKVEARRIHWLVNLPEKNDAFILAPNSELFVKIGKMYVQEWEKEFGKGEYYLADSFNEMDVPISKDSVKALQELAGYGESVYNSIKEANPDAVWVMQGWTFPFHKDKEGKIFWTPKRLDALMSKVPNDKMLVLDLANEYNVLEWKIDASWKKYDGFFGKSWIYSFIPNMGGKNPLNGRLDLYATMPIEALNFKNKKNLIGYGFAPEGIENNEIVYELVADMGWRTTAIDLDSWIASYCKQRYGAYPEQMKTAFDFYRKSCYGSFVSQPLYRYQLKPFIDKTSWTPDATVKYSKDFEDGVIAFLVSSEALKNSELYKYDALESASQLLAYYADAKLYKFLANDKNTKELDEALEIMQNIDRLLTSHPLHNLKRWVDFARAWGDNEKEKNYYEANAKKLITTWGGEHVADYAGRAWSGVIRDYYIPRWKHHFNTPQDIIKWEDSWVATPGISDVKPFENPVDEAKKLIKKYKK